MTRLKKFYLKRQSFSFVENSNNAQIVPIDRSGRMFKARTTVWLTKFLRGGSDVVENLKTKERKFYGQLKYEDKLYR